MIQQCGNTGLPIFPSSLRGDFLVVTLGHPYRNISSIYICVCECYVYLYFPVFIYLSISKYSVSHSLTHTSLTLRLTLTSHLPQTLQLNLTGKGRWQDPRRIEMEHIHLNQIVLLLLTAEKYRLRKPYRHWDDMEWKLSVWVWFWRNLKKESARWFDASEPDVQRFFRAQVLGVGERNLILLKKHG